MAPGADACQSLSSYRPSSLTSISTAAAVPAGTSASTRTRCQRHREMPLSIRAVRYEPLVGYASVAGGAGSRGRPCQVKQLVSGPSGPLSPRQKPSSSAEVSVDGGRAAASSSTVAGRKARP